MAYDEELAERVRELVGLEDGLTEMRMFGGLAFLIDGYIAVAVSGKGGLMARVEPAETEQLLRKPGAGPFEMNGRELEGWLRLEADAVRGKRQLEPWVRRGVSFARSQPPKR